MEAALRKSPTAQRSISKYAPSIVTWIAIALLSALVLFHTQALALTFANYLSIRTLERAPNTQLVIGREGVANPSLNVVMGPRVATLAPIDVSVNEETRATLRGEILDMNIDTTATVWFEWGYDTNLGNIVGTQTATAAGIYSATITGQTPYRTIHYRFVVEGGDGTNYGNPHSFVQTGGLDVTMALVVAAVFGVAVIVGLLVLIAGNLSIPVVLMAIVTGILGTIGLSILVSLLMGMR